MGIDPVTMFIASAALQTVSGIAQYSQQKKADKAAKNAAFAEASLMEQDAERAALQEKIESERVRKQQKLAFLASGVDLEGSPLLLMEETRNQGEENAKNVREGGYARASLTRQQGSIGRASLVGTASNIASGLTNTYSQYKSIK